MKTFSVKTKDIKNNWLMIDATNKTLGRLATAIAFRLRGKHKPEFTPHLDTGDYIVVTNAEKISVTGNKKTDKVYYHHSGYQGGIKAKTLAELLKETPTKALYLAVKRMLPKGPLGRKTIQKLKIYIGDKHPHVAQHPQELSIEE